MTQFRTQIFENFLPSVKKKFRFTRRIPLHRSRHKNGRAGHTEFPIKSYFRTVFHIKNRPAATCLADADLVIHLFFRNSLMRFKSCGINFEV